MKPVELVATAERVPAFNGNHTIQALDPELWAAIEGEHRRQHDHIELIASENYVSPAVTQAQGSQLTNKRFRYTATGDLNPSRPCGR